MHPKGSFKRVPEKTIVVKGVNRDIDQRNRRQLTHPISTGEHIIAERGAFILVTLRLRSEHQVRKVDIPFMGRHIWALGHVAKVAHVTLVHDLEVIILIDTINFHGVTLIDQVEQRGERITQTDAPATAMTDVIDPFQL